MMLNKQDVPLKERNYSLELLRTLSMIMIVFMHMQTHGGVKEIWNESGYLKVIMLFLTILSVCAVNVFVMISGYFMIDREFKVSRILSIVAQVCFYSWLLALILITVGKISLFSEEAIRSIFPIAYRKYWFATMYVGMVLLSPIINICIRNMTKKQHLSSIVILLIMTVAWSDIIPKATPFNVESGYSVVWFTTLYMVSAYIRLYIDIDKVSRGKCAISYFGCAGIILCITLLMGIVLARYPILGGYLTEIYYYRYNSIFVVIESCSIFLFFLKLKISNIIIVRIVKFFAPLAFGVYLISDNDPFRDVLWSLVSNIVNFEKSFLLPFKTILVAILIFILCGIVDLARKSVFDFIENTNSYMKFKNKIDGLSTRMFHI